MNTENATPELFAALAKAQGEVENASKASSNPHFKSKYADLAEILNTVRPTFSAHGIAIIQSSSYDGQMVSVTTILAHATGGFVESEASCVPAKTDGQGIGAATTYLRRYSLAAMAGIAQEDDDGNSASHNKPLPASPFDISAIKTKITELGIDEEALLSFIGATSIDALSSEQARKALAAIAKKERQISDVHAAVSQAAATVKTNTAKSLDKLIESID